MPDGLDTSATGDCPGPRGRWRARAGDRTPVSVPVAGDVEGTGPIDLQLQDISSFGFRGRTLHVVQRGAAISLTLPELGQVPATIVWESGITFGGRFLRPLTWRRVHDLMLSFRPAA